MNGDAGGARIWRFMAWTIAAVLFFLAAHFLMKQTPSPPPKPVPPAEPERVADARRRCGSRLRAIFEKAGLRWPADEVLLRAMKREGQLELWARNEPGESFRFVKWLPITAASGGPGPKRREGDMQVPEGFYEVDRFNPFSNFHLSLGLNYPNASDLIHADPDAPGSDIFIHGGNASIGCVALGDDGIEEIYLAASDSRARPIRVQLFPARMDAADWPAWRDAQLAAHPGFRPLWDELAAAWTRFVRERR
jgi:hypothetical protein